MSRGENEARDAAIVRAYHGGASYLTVAKQFGLSFAHVRRIVLSRAPLTPEQAAARRAAHAAWLNSPEMQAKSQAGRRHRLATKGPWQGRRTLFADDPKSREDYLALRGAYGAAYARAAMGLAQ